MDRITLKTKTDPEWAEIALRDLDSLLIDHAACERKAAATGMSLVVKYPEYPSLTEPLVRFTREELDHFLQVSQVALSRGLRLRSDAKDPYAVYLHLHCRPGKDERLLDRLLIAAMIEARSHERLGLIAERLSDPALKTLYTRLVRAEGRHKELFIELAEGIFPPAMVAERLAEWLEIEAKAIAAQPFGSRVH